MRKRHVFATPSLSVAEEVTLAAKRHGIDDQWIRFEARTDIERARIADERKNVSMDFIPAAWHGILFGAAGGGVLGLVLMWMPAVALPFSGVLLFGLIGALVAGWVSAMVGSAIPDEVRRTFSQEIEDGKILVVIDAEPEDFETFEAEIARLGGARLSFESTTALS